MLISPLGDSAAVISLGETVDSVRVARIRAIAAAIERHPPAGLEDVVPAFASVAVFVDPARAGSFEELAAALRKCVEQAEEDGPQREPRTIEIPVCYGGEFGPDIETVAAHARLTLAEVVRLHSEADYLVHAIGFSPGFPYLGGLPPALATPRRATPRPLVPAGSVGIGGGQTGVYSLSTPGGWNLIGRTPRVLFDIERTLPALLAAGDRVRFRPIPAEQFEAATEERSAANSVRPRVEGTPALEVVKPGMFTTVQDSGRRGHRAAGVPLAGAADPFALRLVNALVGNPDEAAALEFTLVGPELKFLRAAVIAVGGGECAEVPSWRPLAVAAGTTVRLGPLRRGCRGYLAVAGGIAVEPVLGSRSTYGRGKLGGLNGRTLREGDLLPVPDVRRQLRNHWWIDERILPRYSAAATVRVVPGAQAGEFDAAWQEQIFRVSTQSDRMGMRVNSSALLRREPREMVSLPVAPGTIQVPPDGQPIVLLADAQTIGGYPQLAHVISVDLPLVAQLRPGDTLRFAPVTLAEARALILAREKAFGLLREGIAQKLA